MNLFRPPILWLFAFILLSVTPCHCHDPQLSDQAILAQIGLDERLGEAVPPDLIFTDQDGKSHRLGEFLGQGPVILTLNYFTCPTLCPITLRNLAASVNALHGVSLARDFRILTISIDPNEQLALARHKATESHAFVKGVEEGDERWPFLVGSSDSIKRLTNSVGFRFVRVGKEFAHPNVIVVLRSDGRISRYLYGLEPSPRDLKLALVEAAAGKIGTGTLGNQALLFCYHYDPQEGRYTLAAFKLVRLGALVVLASLILLIIALRIREQKNKHG